MSMDISKQAAYSAMLQSGLSITKQAAYAVMREPKMEISKQSAYAVLLFKTPETRRRGSAMMIG